MPEHPDPREGSGTLTLHEPDYVIWRYTIPIADDHEVLMPTGARVMDAQRREGGSDREVDVWAMVDQRAALHPVRFRVAGTGHRVGPATHPRGYWRHISTVQVLGGRGVFHVFVQEVSNV